MKKRLVALLLTAILALSLVACGGTEEPKDESKTETKSEESESEGDEAPKEVVEEKQDEQKVESINFVVDNASYVFKRAEKATDFEGKPALIVYFDWTNTSGENAMDMTLHSQLFQNGIECETAILTEANEAINNSMKEIQDGITLEVAYAWVLQDDSPATLKVSELMSFDSKAYQEQEITVQ